MDGLLHDFWGVFISVQLAALIVAKWVSILKQWNAPQPVSLPEVLYAFDLQKVSEADAKEAIKALIDSSNLDLKNFFVDEIRRKEQRDFTKKMNENKRKNERDT